MRNIHKIASQYDRIKGAILSWEVAALAVVAVMAESNEKPPQCPCGFWGSVQTSGLCSVCYKERQKQNRDCDAKLFTTSGRASSASDASSGPCEVDASLAGKPDDDDDNVAASSVTAESSTDPVTNAGVRELAADDDDADSSTSTPVNSASRSRDASPSLHTQGQKNKRRCYSCRARLELIVMEIGRCKCGYTFCELHRLPEQHACTYDYKLSGRQEARDKMVSPKKHVGTSLRRLDSDT